MTKERIFLIIIFLVSFFVRTYRVGDTPPLLWDEAALGYNAYSILHTLRDEHGQFLPLIFKSFGDYKPGAYVYLSIPFVAIFGLNPISIRLYSILAGSLLPVLFYLFLAKKQKPVAVIAAVLIAFNPFNIHFSRGAWESNLLLFLLLLASYSFTHRRYLFSSLIFALSFYTYQSAKLFVPFVILILLLTSANYFRKIFISFFLPLFFLSLPLIAGLLFATDSNRLKVMSLFSYPRSPAETQIILNESGKTDYLLFHNRLIFFGRNFLSRYFNHFSPRFLVFEGDWQNPRHSAPYISLFLYPTLVFFIIGLFSQKPNLFFLLWLILAPIPSALSRDSVSAVRALPLSLPIIYFSSIGISKLIKFKNLIILSYALSFIYYSDLYLNHLIKKSPKDLLYGYHQAVDFVIKNQLNYHQIIFSPFYGQPYIYYLFYSQYPPQKYQQINSFSSSDLDTGHVSRIDNIYFREPNFNQIQSEPNTLAIFSHDEVLRQNINPHSLIPLAPIGDYSTFYAYQNP